MRRILLIFFTLFLGVGNLHAQDPGSLGPTDGDGPFDRLVIRGATMIEGSGAPPIGPVDIVVENDRLTKIQVVGNPGLPIDPDRRPAPGTKEIDAHECTFFLDLWICTLIPTPSILVRESLLNMC